MILERSHKISIILSTLHTEVTGARARPWKAKGSRLTWMKLIESVYSQESLSKYKRILILSVASKIYEINLEAALRKIVESIMKDKEFGIRREINNRFDTQCKVINRMRNISISHLIVHRKKEMGNFRTAKNFLRKERGGNDGYTFDV